MAKEETLYIKLEDSVELRRAILESSRDLLRNLQRFERINSIREAKDNEIEVLNKCMREINLLIGKVRETMPNVNVKVGTKKIKMARLIEEEEPKKAAKERPRELEELENQLKYIEGKLDKLG